MPSEWTGLLMQVAAGVLAFVGAQVVWARVARPSPGTALLIHGRGPLCVAFGPRILWLGQTACSVPLGPHLLEVSLRGPEAVVARDGQHVDIVAHVELGLPRDSETVRSVVEWLGPERPNDPAAIDALFRGHVAHALRAVMSTFVGDDVYHRHEELCGRLVELLGPRLRGYRVDSLAISSALLIPSEKADVDVAPPRESERAGSADARRRRRSQRPPAARR